MDPQKKKETCMSTVIRIAILGWSAALLTASYAGALSKMDPTFIATVFTASAATFGINTMKKSGDDDDEKKTEPKREEFVETPPTPAPEAAVESVESVETVVEQARRSLMGKPKNKKGKSANAKQNTGNANAKKAKNGGKKK
jgi:hypothetical protein